ncbi:MAG TPA: hypothetical protein VJ719_15720, partial [Chthoniobacterales bacterium]|nr:hypothetical protein [Chthoniobacterales bacterium]
MERSFGFAQDDNRWGVASPEGLVINRDTNIESCRAQKPGTFQEIGTRQARPSGRQLKPNEDIVGSSMAEVV